MKKETSPITEIFIKTKDERHIWAKLYWSQNSGMYGHQIIMEYNTGDNYKTYTTSGCGYCKESDAFEHFMTEVLNKRFSCGGSADYFFRGTKAHKGGNYYETSLNQIKTIIHKNKRS